MIINFMLVNMSEAQKFTIDTALAPAHMDEVLEFIFNFYLLPQPDSFDNVHKYIEVEENSI